MTATLKTGIVQEPSSSIANLTLSSSGGVTFGAAATTNTITSAAATALTIQSAGTTAMTIDTSQNVGIGTTSPSTKLTVSGSANVTGTITANAVLAGYVSGTSNIYIRNLSGFNRIDSYNDPITATYPLIINSSLMRFNIADVETMRIDSSGNLLVGTTIVNPGIGNNNTGCMFSSGGFGSVSRGDTAWYVNYTGTGTGQNVRLSWQGTVVGNISTTSTATAYNTSSDYRLKENVQPLTTGLATIGALKPVTYDWISDKSNGEGFIAHELQAVIPHAVTGDKDAVDENGKPQYQGVDYSKIVVHLVAALQELSAKVDAQAAEITALKAKVGA